MTPGRGPKVVERDFLYCTYLRTSNMQTHTPFQFPTSSTARYLTSIIQHTTPRITNDPIHHHLRRSPGVPTSGETLAAMPYSVPLGPERQL